ncbi:hypothetical protein ACKS0A_06797 [Histoplasma ohiense]
MSAAFLLDSMRSNSPVEFGCAPPPPPAHRIYGMGLWSIIIFLSLFLFSFSSPSLLLSSFLFLCFLFVLTLFAYDKRHEMSLYRRECIHSSGGTDYISFECDQARLAGRSIDLSPAQRLHQFPNFFGCQCGLNPPTLRTPLNLFLSVEQKFPARAIVADTIAYGTFYLSYHKSLATPKIYSIELLK